MPTTITTASSGQRRVPTAIRPAEPRPTLDNSGGRAPITKITALKKTIAPKVSSNALPRFLTKVFGWSRS